MEKYFLKEDIKLICVPAKSFPDGVMEAFKNLEKIVDTKKGRGLFGISYPGADGNIIYKAAAVELSEDEAEKLGCESFTILKGTYNNIVVHDFMNNIQNIGKAFDEILKDPIIDPNGCCVEMYINDKDVRCMVRLDPDKILSKEKVDELENTLNEFTGIISSLNDDLLNKEFKNASWTLGQVGRHVIRVNSGFLKQLNGPVEKTKRRYDELAENINTSFLNFNIRMTSPDFVLPEKAQYKRDDLVVSLKEINDGLVSAAKSLDMTQTCRLFELPVLGYLTRYEAVTFVISHAKRHIHFLKKRIQSLN